MMFIDEVVISKKMLDVLLGYKQPSSPSPFSQAWATVYTQVDLGVE
jgi:hypothetical protein